MDDLSSLGNFELLEQIYESPNSRVFRVRKSAADRTEILKLLTGSPPSAQQIVRLHQERLIAQRIESPYVAKVYGLLERGDWLGLRVEDIDGRSLANWLQTEAPSILEALQIAIAVCEGLVGIHARSIAHKAISASNVIWNRDSGETRIIDFGIASVLEKDLVRPETPQKLDGNLAYMSPEQTGRMNRPVDFRSDFYSLGITLFELLTRSRPFVGHDALELIHSHIARHAPKPSSLNPDVPDILDDVVAKLLEKNAENRYQSAGGILRDLQEIERQLAAGSSVERFEIGRHDRANQFLIPAKLYGRDEDVAHLLQAFERVCQGKMIMSLVSGYSGVGKSSLVQELYRPLAATRGRYITGKFDQFQRDVPYSAVANAFNGFCDQILAEPSESVDSWRARIQRSVGNNGSVLIEVVRGIEQIIGPQPAVPVVDPQASKNRFNQVFSSFIAEICSAEAPLVWFIDDLQWIDQASLELLKTILMQSEMDGLHIVGAYRDNEVEASHPLSLTLNALNNAGRTFDEVHLDNLTADNIANLVSDTLGLPPSQVTDLVDVICAKTQGNAFFATEFLKRLHDRRMLKYSDNQWRWNIRQIDEENITDNVVEFMANKLRDFEAATQDALKFASCIGNQFDLRTLAIILDREGVLPEVLDRVRSALAAGVIRSPNDEYKKVGVVDVNGSSVIFKFQHDRVQQAAYSLIPQELRPHIHLQIGRLLKADVAADSDERLFEVVSHLNQAIDIVEDAAERLEICRLNHDAGSKAMLAAAYQAASEYFVQAKSLLPEDCFESRYDLAMQVHVDLAKSLYINGEFQRSEMLYPLLLERAASPMDEVRVRMVQMEDYHLQGDYEKAIAVQTKGLFLLGEPFPGDDAALEEAISAELELTPGHLGDRRVDELLTAAEFESEAIHAKLRILVGMWMSAYLVSKDPIVQWCSIKLTNLTLMHGNSELAAFAYVQYGYVCAVRLEEYEKGWQFGNLAIRLADRYDNIEMRGKVYFNFAIFVNHWTQHVRTSTELFRTAYACSVEGGDWTYAVYGAANIVSNLLIAGQPCLEVAAEAEKYLEFLQSRAEVGLNSFFMPGGYVALLNLQGKTAGTDTFDCEWLNEQQLLDGLGQLPIVEAWFYSAKLRSLFLFRHLELAAEVVQKPDIVAAGVPSQIKVPEAYFYGCLIITAILTNETAETKKRSLQQRLQSYAARLDHWATKCPENFLHKHLLVRAESSRLSNGDARATLHLYDSAIQAARDAGYPNNAAVACELKARYLLQIEQPDYALVDLNQALQLYRTWGVNAKVQQLLAEFPLLARESQPTTSYLPHTGTMSLDQIDLDAIYQSAQAISGKVSWDDLVESMLSIVMENVGANRALFLVKGDPQWQVRAAAEVDQTSGRTEMEISQTIHAEFPQSVVNFVKHSEQILVTDSDSLDAPYASDPYFNGRSDLSVLCAPVVSHDRLNAILYLENSLASGVFTEDRERVLDILLTQISISLENASLYEDLGNRVRERTADLAKANQALEESNIELQQFAYIASHDLQTPLRAIAGFAQFLQKDYQQALDETGLSYLKEIVGGAKRMEMLIDDLLKFSRVEARTFPFEATDLNEVMNDVCTLLKIEVDARQAVITQDELPTVRGDRSQLSQLMQNLMSNALKYCGEERTRVHVSAELANNEWTIAVEDNGIGISPDYHDRIFEIFKRLHAEDSYPGTGIGLAVCRRIVQRHGGQIWVESIEGEGSTFYFTIPTHR